MIERPFWIQKIKRAWEKRSIVWLSGVRRVGKTTLAKMFHDALYFNCDLPSVARQLSDPELFFSTVTGDKPLIFDEIHQIENPSQVLKIAADMYPHLKILATGSSTLAATQKFRDALTGRKQTIYLPPILWTECSEVFHIHNFDRRLLHGGLPEALLSEQKETWFYVEWMDSFYARDIQELFSIRNRVGFLKLLQLLFRQSGGILDYTSLAKLSDLSRPTVKAHVEAMTIAHAVFLLPPFHGGGRRELTRRPKCYAFDTGFITFVNGWESLREEDRGLLWEHLVLDWLRTRIPEMNLYYWRDKSGREVDFVIRGKDGKVHTVECKIAPGQYSPRALRVFRQLYPEGENFVVCPLLPGKIQQSYQKLVVNFVSLQELSYFPNFSEIL